MKREAIPCDCGEQEFKAWMQRNAEELLAHVGLRAGLRVLDYGCGHGTYAIPAARLVGEQGTVCAVDRDAKAVASMRAKAQSERMGNIQAIKASQPADLPPGSAFHVILLYDVLQMVDEQAELLRQLRERLRPDGLLSVFPLHVGAERLLRLVAQDGLFVLRDRSGWLLNFRPAEGARKATPCAAHAQDLSFPEPGSGV